MYLTVNGQTVETDQDGFLKDPKAWDNQVMKALVAQHEAETEQPLSDTALGLVDYVREFYDEHQTVPGMHEIVNQLGRHDGESFMEAQEFKTFLYELFPHGPVQSLAKLAGLPNPGVENES